MSAFSTRAKPNLDPLAAPKPTADKTVEKTAGTPETAAPAQAMSSADPSVQQARIDLSKGQYGEGPAPAHPLLAKLGQGLRLTLGVGVTEGLALLPSWNQPVLDAQGKPVTSVPGAERIDDHDILKRHQEVVGPQLAALDAKIAPGAQRAHAACGRVYASSLVRHGHRTH